jgi:hypothetical protein
MKKHDDSRRRLNLERTARAIAILDRAGKTLDECPGDCSVEYMFDIIDTYEDAKRGVGIAFGLDTADRNSYIDCVEFAQCHAGERFIRRMVTEWMLEESKKNLK